MRIDTTFDFRDDTPPGRDPDKESAMLRRYHRTLWSKPLPNGVMFDLTDTTRGVYLHHRSDELGEHQLSSDSVMQTFTRWSALRQIVEPVGSDRNAAFQRLAYSIGGMMLFPGNKINGQITINAARGFNRSISDRMDLTLECIRCHYLGEPSPLGSVLSRYSDFFALFGSLAGYVDFWLLNDLVIGDRVRFFLPFDGFMSKATPADTPSYTEFQLRSMDFIHARNARIAELAARGTLP